METRQKKGKTKDTQKGKNAEKKWVYDLEFVEILRILIENLNY